MAETITVVIKADDQASGVFKKIGGSLGSIGKVASVAAVAGIAAVGVAASAVAIKGLAAFTSFERGMNEVFTLLPSISGAAMDDMEKQVLNLSKEFGVLPDEVVPALYQALSAGVPPDNVFEFMVTATKASIGGVTDLEVAVDGITSVINAYGTETIDAGKASDIMFTAVKLGKTTMEELSSSVFQATPLAAALGVSFEEIAGATASLTKQGVPTTVAMTQIRQSMVALQKPNKDMVDLLEAAGFASGQAALESTDLASVLGILREASDDSGVSMEKAFGSVEALGAVLALTGDNAEGAAADFLAMVEAGGATEAAFDQMNQGIGPVIDKFRAWKDVMFITIGDALAPMAEKLLVFAQSILPQVEAFIIRVSDAFAFLFDAIGGGELFAIFEDGSSILGTFFEKLGVGEEKAKAIAAALITVKDVVLEVAGVVGDLVSAFAAIALPVLGDVATFFAENIPKAVSATTTIIRDTLIPAVQDELPGAITFSQRMLKAMADGFLTWWPDAVEFARDAIRGFVGGLLDMIAFLGNTVRPWILNKLVPWFEKNIPIAVLIAKDTFKGFMQLLGIVGTWIFDVLIGKYLKALWDFLKVEMPFAIAASILFFVELWLAMIDIKNFIVDDLLPFLGDLIDTIGDFLPGAIVLAIPGLANLLTTFNGIRDAVKFLIDKIKSLIKWLSKIKIPSILHGFSPSPFEVSLRGISEAMQELNTMRLPQFAANLNALQPAGGMVSTTTHGATFNLSLQTGQSSGSVIQEFGLMQAVAAGR